jgi:hypothetical protein
MLYIFPRDVNQKTLLNRKEIKKILHIALYLEGLALPDFSPPEITTFYIRDIMATRATVRAASRISHRSVLGFLFLIARKITIA